MQELSPLLMVADIEQSITFYCDQLDFSVVSDAKNEGRIFWYRVNRGGASIMLQQSEEEYSPAERHGQGVASTSFAMIRTQSPRC